MVYGEVRAVKVYNAGLWDSMYWTCILHGKTKPSPVIEIVTVNIDYCSLHGTPPVNCKGLSLSVETLLPFG